MEVKGSGKPRLTAPLPPLVLDSHTPKQTPTAGSLIPQLGTSLVSAEEGADRAHGACSWQSEVTPSRCPHTFRSDLPWHPDWNVLLPPKAYFGPIF